jgi:phage terminase large subunit
MEGIDIVWVEEAEKVSKNSWQTLIPTIRKPGSEIWITFNPDEETDPTYQRFVVNPPPDAIVRKVNWRDNPYFPEELRREMEYLKSVDYDAYLHVWEGETRKRSDAQILNGKWTVEWFEPQPGWDGPYYGADWGFANDPTAGVRMWVNATDPRGPELMIEHEVYGLRVDIDKTPELFDRMPQAREHTIRADNARPETISYMQNHGYPSVVACAKWPGSVEDGITFLRSFRRIVIHTRCTHTAQEARLYSYKVDRLSGDVLRDIVDKHNHCWDAIRYGLEPLIKGSGLGMLHYTQGLVVEQATQEDKIRSMLGG